MRTSEVAAQARVNTQTLRYYERRGLLPEPKRTRSGYRTYTSDTVRVVRFVKRAQQLGFSLDDIDELLRIDELAGMRDALASLIDTCDWPRAERDCPLVQDIETAAATTTSTQRE
ncbi:DNA-binding transcriptional MerR regulator [Mycobacterium frederiksbergense]|uniref:DNA-binding transcriptional MerR regulator n=1 Tax=Mycolicibacterium frederiksbergense TaxID=117567 RepID=A0ABT6KS44_9MYCO|nr:MerR family transcriptional regulator [Mycolicibacterium frederiksbergense]MDH6193383.1 DNA-binding transcriptional MerR regulator [Mycolicibacterium frederiksbergense]